MLYLTCTTITSIDLAHYGVSRAKDWVSVKCGTITPCTRDHQHVYLAGAPVAQWGKRWTTDLAVPSSSPAQGKIFSTVNGVPLHRVFHYQPLIVLI